MTRAKSVQTVTGPRHHRYRAHHHHQHHHTTPDADADAQSHPVVHSPTMAWALYLSNTSATSVTDAQLAELDDFELVRRTGAADATAAHLDQRIGHIVHALICAAGAVNSRSHMLRSVGLLYTLLTDADPILLRTAVRGVISQSLTTSTTSTTSTTATAVIDHHHLHNTDSGKGGYCTDNDDEQARALAQQDPPFLRPLVSIAVNRVSDGQLSSAATHCLAILLGNPVLDEPAVVPPALRAQTAAQTRRLVAHLITQVVLTASPAALESLARLLRRDRARIAFCHKDGVSTLASTLRTTPDVPYTAIGAEVVGTASAAAATLAADSLALHRIGKTGPTGRISSSSSRNNNSPTGVSYSQFIRRTTDSATSRVTTASGNVSSDNNVYSFNSQNSPVYASYHAVFAVWMLSFASRPAVVRAVLQHVVDARLVVTLANLLSHASGQRLKIARVTLASLRNLAVGPRDQQHVSSADASTGATTGHDGHGSDDTANDYDDFEDTDEDSLAIALSTKNRSAAQQHHDKRANGSSLTRSVSSSTNSTSTSTSTSSVSSQSSCAPRTRPVAQKTLTNRPQSIEALRKRVRRDLLAAQVPTVLQRLMSMASVQSSLMGSDADAVADARALLHVLDAERESMSTLDVYAAQVRAGTLSLSSSGVHDDPAFWTRHAAALVDTRPDLLRQLAAVVCGPGIGLKDGSAKKANGPVNGNGAVNEEDDDDDDDDDDDEDDVDVGDDDDSDLKKHARRRRRREQETRGQQQQDTQADATTRAIACTHLAHVMRYAPAGKQAIMRHAPQLKGALMQTLATEQTPAALKKAALICMQTLLVHHSLRR